ncbi:MAG: phosphatase PAP2 family protein [Deltaproteobacteria bacterium]|nr:phosphatase PAP2 family protein [Deltaproteobacteria bacterium]
MAIFSFQLLPIPSAWSKDKKAAESNPEDAPVTAPDLKLSPKDQEFSERSVAGEKFTFKDIPRDLGGSMKESFWGWGSLAFGLGIGLTAGLHEVDSKLQNSFQPNALFGSTGNDVIGWTISPYTIGGVSVITWIVAANTDHPKLALTSRALTEALFLSLGIDTVTKLAFRRQRPDGGNLSFPSAHATAAFTAAGVLTEFYGWKAAIPSYALASLVSVSRVDGYHHFLSDVVMGAVLGSVIGIGTAKFHKKEHPNFFLSPTVSKGNASIGFTYIH